MVGCRSRIRVALVVVAGVVGACAAELQNGASSATAVPAVADSSLPSPPADSGPAGASGLAPSASAAPVAGSGEQPPPSVASVVPAPPALSASAVSVGSPGEAPEEPRFSISGAVTTVPASAAKNAVVYVEDGPLDKPVDGVMDNRQMAFVPHVVVLTKDGKFTVTNSDPFPHNAFSPDHDKWDFGVLAAHGTRSKRFEKPGVYTVLCNMHPNMKGYVVAVPSSYFAKADGKGQFAIAGVAKGKYHVTAWAPGVKPVTQSVQVDGDVPVSFELHR